MAPNVLHWLMNIKNIPNYPSASKTEGIKDFQDFSESTSSKQIPCESDKALSVVPANLKVKFIRGVDMWRGDLNKLLDRIANKPEKSEESNKSPQTNEEKEIPTQRPTHSQSSSQSGRNGEAKSPNSSQSSGVTNDKDFRSCLPGDKVSVTQPPLPLKDEKKSPLSCQPDGA